MPVKTLFFLISVLIMPFGHQEPPVKEKIQWMTIEEASVKMKEEPRPIIIDVYAKWCYWCKVMDKKTYSNGKVIDYINKNFYPVKFDAESKQTVNWESRDFSFNPEIKVNEFSLYMTSGDLSFPTTVIYTSAGEAPAAIPGYMSPDEMEPVLKYFGEEIYREQGFQEFLKNFKKDW